MDLLERIYFMSFALGGAFAGASWLLAHAQHAHGHHAHGPPKLAHAPKLAHGPKLVHAPRGGHAPKSASSFGAGLLARVLAPLGNASALAALATVFGATGWIARKLGSGAATSVFVASASGLVAAYAVGSLFGFLAKSTREVRPLEPRGHLARVVCRIGERTVGEIALAHDGRTLSLPAKSADGGEIEIEAEVVILGVERGIATVARASDAFASERGTEEGTS